jgi:hypothetical protein
VTDPNQQPAAPDDPHSRAVQRVTRAWFRELVTALAAEGMAVPDLGIGVRSAPPRPSKVSPPVERLS